MILPIIGYGHKILRQRCDNIKPNFPQFDKLIDDMWETMQNAGGCGLAAPQIGQAIRLFIVDSKTTYDNFDEIDRKDYFADADNGIAETFINAQIIEQSETYWEDKEGCLSIPGLSQIVMRPWTITLEYYNRGFEKKVKIVSGATARMIQHEYDHTEGILYLDYLKPLTKKILESKLRKISKGQVKARYPMLYK